MKEVGVGQAKLLCRTGGWNDTLHWGEFREMYENILDCLTAISNNEGKKWSS